MAVTLVDVPAVWSHSESDIAVYLLYQCSDMNTQWMAVGHHVCLCVLTIGTTHDDDHAHMTYSKVYTVAHCTHQTVVNNSNNKLVTVVSCVIL